MHSFKTGDRVLYPSPLSGNYREPVPGVVAWVDGDDVTVKPEAGGLEGVFHASELTRPVVYVVDNDGDETRTDEAGLRRMARSNGIIDWDTWPVADLIECITECYPDVTITTETEGAANA